MQPIYKPIIEIRPGDKVPVTKVVAGIHVADGIAQITYTDSSVDRFPDNASMLVEPPPLPEDWQDLTKEQLIELAEERGIELKMSMSKIDMIEALS